ncbi:MAG: hypothetical protein HC898_07155 [Phycisphaerales bacterium]|nr:hypothetical protein [Phycisphaerales bacterium]
MLWTLACVDTTAADLGDLAMAEDMAVSPASARATLQHRLVRLFDFEERKLGNFEILPMHWYIMGRQPDTGDPTFMRKPLHEQLVHRPGYPTFTRLGFDSKQRADGEFSFRLELDGGNVGAFLEAGTIPAVPGSDYLLTAQIRTTDFKYAKAFVHLYFLDSRGMPIPGARVSSAPIVTDGEWQTINIIMPRRSCGSSLDWAGIGDRSACCQIQ